MWRGGRGKGHAGRAGALEGMPRSIVWPMQVHVFHKKLGKGKTAIKTPETGALKTAFDVMWLIQARSQQCSRVARGVASAALPPDDPRRRVDVVQWLTMRVSAHCDCLQMSKPARWEVQPPDWPAERSVLDTRATRTPLSWQPRWTWSAEWQRPIYACATYLTLITWPINSPLTFTWLMSIPPDSHIKLKRGPPRMCGWPHTCGSME